ncbi:hypothetical protein ACOZ4N_03925 [Halorientalis pallida]|uniref:hypothetical protein n=1 Tax=Halorientalis pallida TaxID=2479928 RepID=UPI003C6EA4D6
MGTCAFCGEDDERLRECPDCKRALCDACHDPDDHDCWYAPDTDRRSGGATDGSLEGIAATATRRARLFNVAYVASLAVAGLGAFVVLSSFEPLLLRLGGALFVLGVFMMVTGADLFAYRTRKRLRTSKPPEAARPELASPASPLLALPTARADAVERTEDELSLVYGDGEDAETVTFRIDTSDDGAVVYEAAEEGSITERISVEILPVADGTEVEIESRKLTATSLAMLGYLLVLGSVENEALAVLGYEVVGESMSISLH